MIELNVRFTSSDRFVIKFDDRETDALEFVAPLNDGDRAEIRDYLEKYTSLYMMDVDDRSAERTEAKLPLWGEALFESIFSGGDAKEIFKDFQNSDEQGKILTISASHPLILALPWELLREPMGTYLSHGKNPISIRRSFSQLTNESEFQQDSVKQNIFPPKNRLRLLFVISRPIGAGFLDPRKDALATLEAIAKNAQGLIDVEFLRPATLDKLVERLADKSLPPVDIVHFDGHGVFDVNKNIGYLLFEDIGGNGDRVSAARVGESLSQAGISAMLLSACQTAAVAGEEAMGSVAAGLTHAGIPTVLAMQYSVLTSTTERMFGAFYEHLTQGQRFGEALENARRDLYEHRERGDRQRGRDRVTLRLQDWFLPALYQVGSDRALFSPHPQPLSQGARGDREENPDLLSPSTSGRGARGEGNISELQKAGFWGRAWELWQIERAYVRDTRRVTISGFGGMGKTYLAEEVGRWLLRTGMFARVCLVSYANFQGIDAVSYAVSVLATVLETNLIDAAAVTRALADRSVLVILDNLESLDAEQLVSLLDAAKEWSEVGESRVLLTTRTPDLRHPDYPNYPIAIGRRSKHVSLQLEGLQPNDAVNYFQSLLKLPPAPRLDLPFRNDLLELFELVQRLPLAIGLLAAQLKDRQVLDVRKELEELLVQSPDNPLLASLNLSINRLDPEVRKWLPRLGVFQDGAMEPEIISITGILKTEWSKLRIELELLGLIRVESLIDVSVPFIKFYPTLALAIWEYLNYEEQQQIIRLYRQSYYQLAYDLYYLESENPFLVSTIAQKELQNLLCAVRGAIESNDSFAVEFAVYIDKFLYYFGMNSDREYLNRHLQEIENEVGSQNWLSKRRILGEQLLSMVRYTEATEVFKENLTFLGVTASHEKCITLSGLGRCYTSMGQSELAVAYYHLALEVAENLEQTNSMKQEIGNLQGNLAIVLNSIGDYNSAQEALKVALQMHKDVGYLRGEALTKTELGKLALLQNNLTEAVQLYHGALIIFQQLNQPEMEAIIWHNLGIASHKSSQWEYAEQAYRKSALIKEAQGLIGGQSGAANTWTQLASVSVGLGKLNEAEEWYRKAISGFKVTEDKLNASIVLCNFADFLQQFPERLNEAQQLAEEALEILNTFDPAVAKLWKIYAFLANISDKQSDTDKAKFYRHKSRQALANFSDTKIKLRQHAQIIMETVSALQYQNQDKWWIKKQVESLMQVTYQKWTNLVSAVRQILNGQRDEDILCEKLDVIESQIVVAILRGIADPETLKNILN